MKTELIIMLLIPTIGIVNLIFGFMIGKYHERWKWNELINKKVLPQPYQKYVALPKEM